MSAHPSEQVGAIDPGKVQIQEQHIRARNVSSHPLQERGDLVAVLGDEHFKLQLVLAQGTVDQENIGGVIFGQ